MNTQISDECGVELLSIEPSRTGYDLNLDILDDPQDCRVTLFARDGLYQRAEADTLVKSYKKLIKAFVEEPAAPLAKPVMYDHGDVQAALRFSQSKPCITSCFYLRHIINALIRPASYVHVASHRNSQIRRYRED